MHHRDFVRAKAAFAAAHIAGPSLGTLIYQSVGRSAVFLFDAVSYVVSAVSLLLIRTEFRAAKREPEHDLAREILDGLRWLWKKPLIRYSLSLLKANQALRKFLYKNLYFSAALDPERNDAERVIRELFGFWMTKPESLPHNYQEKAEQEPLARVVCDYIAGMTDNFIYEQYAKYCGGS